METIKVKKGGVRLDSYLKTHFGDLHTRSQITNSINEGRTTLNGQTVKNGKIVEKGDVIVAQIEVLDLPAEPENIPLDVIFEDEHLIVLNKPKGMVVHPGAGVRGGTLLNALLYRFGMKAISADRFDCAETDDNPKQKDFCQEEVNRAGIVHRLDKNTAGLLVVAKNAKVQEKLCKMFEERTMRRTYQGLVEGHMHGQGTVHRNIVRDPNNRTRYKTDHTKGRNAITHYKVLGNYRHGSKPISHVQFNLETGRTHQIRVHMKSINHPLVGDTEYNFNSSMKIEGQVLESVELAFVHPITGKQMEFKIEPKLLEIVGKLHQCN